MPAKIYNQNFYLGDTIQEKTRTLLGWDSCKHKENGPNESQPSLSNHLSSINHHQSSAPYTIPWRRARKNSTSSLSTCSECSQPSPSCSIHSNEAYSPEPYSTENFTPKTAFRSVEREARVFERLRQFVPVLPTDRNAYQVLIDTISQVMDLEHQLEQLNEQTEDVKNSLLKEETYHIYEIPESAFPDDLESVDVSEFKHLLCSVSATNGLLKST